MNKTQYIKRIYSFDPQLISLLFSSLDDTLIITPNERFFESENNILLVSFSNQQPTGFLYAYLLEDIKSMEPGLILYSIDVFHAYRRTGIARRLIEELKSVAKNQGCRKIFVITDAQNIPAINLYRKTGANLSYKEDVLLVFE